jgi:glycosyltransferase involved in cell wall biosynthesis
VLRTIGINAIFLEPGQSGGSETYLRGLVPALVRRRGLRIVVFTTHAGVASLRESNWHDMVELVPVRADTRRASRLWAEQVAVPRLAARMGCDVLHSLANTGPWRSPVPHVLTLLDVIFITTNTLGTYSSLALRRIVPPVARAADAVITISATARDEILRVLGLPADSVEVIRLASDARRAQPTGEAEVRARYGLETAEQVILCVSAYRPHKNQELLIRALPGLVDAVLVLVGPDGGKARALAALAHQLGVADRVRMPGYTPNADLEGLYAVAACVASASLAEGFGLSVLEAMSRGVPVACSTIGPHLEVGLEFPYYFDPQDPRGAADAIGAAVAAPSERLEAAAARAREFTWDATAASTALVYERVTAP